MSFTAHTARFAAAAMLLAGGSTAALADGAHFEPDTADVSWDGTNATVAFREVDVALEAEATTISVRVTADVDAVCRRGDSTLHLHRSATALDVRDYPISEDATVEDTVRIPLKVTGLKVSGFTCVVTQVSVKAVLEDFGTGATLVVTEPT